MRKVRALPGECEPCEREVVLEVVKVMLLLPSRPCFGVSREDLVGDSNFGKTSLFFCTLEGLAIGNTTLTLQYLQLYVF
jgi:hypothetical protein